MTDAPNAGLYVGAGSRPVPDPTELTANLVDKAISNLREILEKEIAGTRTTIEARLDGMDKAIVLLQAMRDTMPATIDAKIQGLQTLHAERFRTVEQQFMGVQTQFLERDVRVRESALAATTAINAALQSQKEAAGEQAKSFTLSIDKSEKGTLEQINQQRVLLETTTKGIDGKIDDLKDRMTRVESIGIGRVAATSEVRATATDTRGTIALAISAGLALLTLIGFGLMQARAP